MRVTTSSNYEVLVSDFGLKVIGDTGYNATDNYNAIMRAIQDCYSKGGGTVRFPMGIIVTLPISLKGYSNIRLLGANAPTPPFNVTTTLLIVGSGSVGIQFSDTTNPIPQWQAPYCAVEGIFLDCNNLVTTGINGNFGLYLRNVIIRRALSDGIVLENYTYPTVLEKVESSYNGRHGIYVRGPQTTKYSVIQCEFSNNKGYGIFMEGGASVTYQDCLCQLNQVGGLKIFWNGIYTGSYILENLLFINQYFEQNGTLDQGNAAYEGNYAVVITSTDKTASMSRKASNIRFIQGYINASTQSSGGTSSGKSYLLDGVYGLKFEGTTVNHSLGSITSPSINVGLETDMGASAAISRGSFPFVNSYQIRNAAQSLTGIVWDAGLYPNRGRTEIFYYTLPSITAGSSVLMNTTLSAINFPKGYPLIQNGSIMGMILWKRSGLNTAGTLSTRFMYAYSNYGADPSFYYTNYPSISLNLPSEVIKKALYTPMQYPVDTSAILGVELTASANYVPGNSQEIVCEVLVEF